VGAGHFQLEAGGLHSPQAEQTPAGGDHRLNQETFDGVARFKLGEQRRGEIVVAARGFSLENHASGEAVVAGVLRGGSFALSGDGAGGFGGVGSIG
jgi:hypothetical protein